MSDYIFETVALVIGVIGFCCGLAFQGYLLQDKLEVYKEAKSVVEICEKSLPRDQSCEYVITAEVITNE